jgi:O-antigen ligase
MNGSAGAEWWRPGSAAGSGAGGGSAAAIVPSSLPFAALMAFTAVLLLAPQTFVPALASLRPGLLTAAAALGAYVLDALLRRRRVVRWTREMALAAALAGWAMATVPLSYWPGGSLEFLVNDFFKTLVIFYLLANVVTTARRVELAAWGLSLMAVPLAAFAVREYLAGRFIDGGPVKRILSFEAPLTQNPNDLALMLNLILPLAVALFLARPGAGARLVLLSIIALVVAAVVLTFSRAGFLTLATVGAAYGIRLARRPGRGWVLAALFAAAACLPLLPDSYVQRLLTITDIETDPTGSAQERWNDTLATLRFVAANPVIGAGPGMNILALNELRGPIWKEVHNVYLEYAADLGLPGLALFLALMVLCARAAAEARRRCAGGSGPGALFFLSEGLQISLIAFAVAAFFHPVAYHVYFYYVAGLALGARAAAAAEARG